MIYLFIYICLGIYFLEIGTKNMSITKKDNMPLAVIFTMCLAMAGWPIFILNTVFNKLVNKS